MTDTISPESGEGSPTRGVSSCPFCGSADISERKKYMVCDNCGGSGPYECPDNIHAWNHRFQVETPASAHTISPEYAAELGRAIDELEEENAQLREQVGHWKGRHDLVLQKPIECCGRCTCAVIVNPDIPHARSCPLYEAK